MTAEKCLMPNMPKFEIVKVPPCNERQLICTEFCNVGQFTHKKYRKSVKNINLIPIGILNESMKMRPKKLQIQSYLVF